MCMVLYFGDFDFVVNIVNSKKFLLINIGLFLKRKIFVIFLYFIVCLIMVVIIIFILYYFFIKYVIFFVYMYINIDCCVF